MTVGRFRARIGRRPAAVAGAVVAGLTLAAVGAAVAVATKPAGNVPPPAKQAILAQALTPPAHPGPQGPKGRGLHAPPGKAPTPPAHAGEVATPDELGGVPLPFSPESFDVTTMWMDLHGQVEIHVYAGDLPADPDQGALAVTRTNAVTGADLPGGGQFPTPQKVGALTLTQVSGNTAFFTYPGGSGRFNLVSDRYSM
jgi:hypothetical protein